MNLLNGEFYHLYNRGINSENIFKDSKDYLLFLKKFRYHLDEHLEVIAYCLMPNHFHFLIKVETENLKELVRQFSYVLSSYAQVFNRKYKRTGSLFQRHSKAKLVQDSKYFLTLVIYIHQNPVRAGFVEKQEDWHYSSFRDFTGYRNGTLPKMELILKDFPQNSKEEFYQFSQDMIKEVKQKYWL
ncbi:MAG: transposase [Calditrichaeota bacterium]|nr:MAG: transposase [Calditrichota bacterium]